MESEIAIQQQQPPPLPPWKQSLGCAIEKNKRNDGAHCFASIATIKPFGRPANRSVYFRGFLSDYDDDLPEESRFHALKRLSNVLVFCCDIRSGSVEDFLHGSRFGEVCW
jgi:hypothetical protein